MVFFLLGTACTFNGTLSGDSSSSSSSSSSSQNPPINLPKVTVAFVQDEEKFEVLSSNPVPISVFGRKRFLRAWPTV